jgi:thioredoxin 1
LQSARMDAMDLSAILTGILIEDNTPENAAASLKVLDKICANALKPDEKFRTLPAGNETVKARVRNTSGALEFLDAVGFSEQANGDLVLQRHDERTLQSALQAVSLAMSQLGSKPEARPDTAADAWRGQAQQEAEARAREIAKRAEEDKKRKELLKKQIAAEQREARDRPIKASVRVDAPARAAGGAGASDGKIRYIKSEQEYDALVSSGKPLLVNYTASWCGPCQAIAPIIEAEAQKNPHMTFCKVDIDENQELAQRNSISAVPTFHVFKNGTKLGEVKGANAEAVKALIAKAA